jgi:hypothetical protein
VDENGLWRLKVIDAVGYCYEACGTRELLEGYYEECKQAIDATDGTGPKTVQVTGITDSADRAEMQFFVKTEDIRGATLVKLY